MTNSRYRFEGDTRSDEVESGLQARVADALWMLARQWQTGEFRGEDASSPIQARFQLDTTSISGFRSYNSNTYTPIDPFVPLEAYVEQQPPGDLAGFLRAAESGMHLLRMLSLNDLDEVRTNLRQDFALFAPTHVEPGEQALVRLLMRRACDGERIFRNQNVVEQSVEKSLSAIEARAFSTIFDSWKQWYGDRLMTGRPNNCWDPERMEYRFRVHAATEQDTVALEAKEYPGGHLDWYSFDLYAAKEKIAPENVSHPKRTVLPAPVQFAGMAASRWWQFEDGVINFGDVNSSGVDFSRMLTAAFATAYGDDWFVIPIRVPIGSLSKIVSLEVLDSFGETVTIDSIASLDGRDRAWRFFELNGDGADHPLLFVPAVALGKLEGNAVENVTLIRDETENIGWGIENSYEGGIERSVNRLQQWSTGRPAEPDTEDVANSDDIWRYRLLNQVPPHWIPFVPVRTDDNAQIRLRRGQMSEWSLLPDNLVGIRGHTLLPNPAAPLLIHEEEVPVSGIEITSSYQFARDVAGHAYIWLGKRKRPSGKVNPVTRDTDAVTINPNNSSDD